ncbi:MAG: hypothetical protein ABI255_00420 [Microbacteriaceae bacterium]
MSTRWARVARGLLAAGFATLVAACFHTAAGGSAPSALALSLSLSFSGIFCVALAGKRLSLWRQAASVVSSQLLYHALFSLGQAGIVGTASGGADVDAAGLGAHGAHALDLGLASVSAAIPSGVASPQLHGVIGMFGDGPAMWAGHAAAALVTIALLRHGEKTFWGMYRTALLHLGQFFDRVFTALAPRTRLVHRSLNSHVSALHDLNVRRGSLGLRGPPVDFVCA